MGIRTKGTVGDRDKFLSPCSSLIQYRRQEASVDMDAKFHIHGKPGSKTLGSGARAMVSTEVGGGFQIRSIENHLLLLVWVLGCCGHLKLFFCLGDEPM